MGRPLNKKYFGNRNFGRAGDQTAGPNSNSQNYADDNIGGEGISSYILPGQLGNIEVDSDSGQPDLVIPAPQIPGGVQATATVTWEVSTITITDTNDYGTDYVNGETVTFTGPTGVTATVTVASDDITGFTIVNRGSFTTLPTGGSYQVVGAVGNDAQAEITWRVKTIVMNEKGSGYTTAPTLSWAAGEAGPISGTSPGAPTAVLSTDSGLIGSATNQENAIIIHANTGNEGDQIGDIIRQVSTRRYKVKTADGIRICELVNDDTPSVGKAYIKATDDNGNTYFVMKLTSRLAVLKQWTNNEATWLFQDNERAHWVFSDTEDSYSAADTVVIENA